MGSIPWQNQAGLEAMWAQWQAQPWQRKKVEVCEGNRNCLVPP